jgi:hypothetical protein
MADGVDEAARMEIPKSPFCIGYGAAVTVPWPHADVMMATETSSATPKRCFEV